jgi:NAD(P)-dependent dehydrogenase (short-subunit alcohol dehydrogenase family)
MQDFTGKTAVVTGGGTGMGRELCRELVKAGCHVATCDVLMDNLEETRVLCEADAPAGTRLTLHECDVSSEESVNRFRDEVAEAHGDVINLLFNNAGIGGGGSFGSEDDRKDWERTFAVCWYGVYYGCRAFLPMLINSDEARIVNTSSINGFWATIGPSVPHTAYCAAKFAVKGFSEALITDLRINSPHVEVSVVMPGHIGTSIAINSSKVLGRPDALDMSEDDIRLIRERMMKTAGPNSEMIMNMSDGQIKEVMHQRGVDFRDKAPTSAGEAANIILSGVKARQWRILVGEDAHRIDDRVRANPEGAYEPEFLDAIINGGDLQALVGSSE